jgi:hypothetical protein
MVKKNMRLLASKKKSVNLKDVRPLLVILFVVRVWLTLLGTPLDGGNVHWRVPRSSNTLFTGRKDILDDLERSVRAAIQQRPGGHDQLRVVISGLGGQGKSEISLQLAQRVRSL